MSEARRVSLRVNGVERVADHVPAHASLLDVLREDLGLPGAKDACRQGECGSCTVLSDGEAVCSCLVHAWQAEGTDVVTIEGVAELEPEAEAVLREELVERGAVQCGFCTPGIVVSVVALLREQPEPGADAVREALSGNLCRCTGYAAIVDAAVATGRRLAG